MVKYSSCIKTGAGAFTNGACDMLWPRIWKAAEENFWTCPACDRPAKWWFNPIMIAPRWRCDPCGIHGRMDSRHTEIEFGNP